MRVELLYAPGCSSYRKARNFLETVIAEEGLPVSIEDIEVPDQRDGSPSLRINGNEVHGSPMLHHIENLREAICNHWKELTEKPMART